MAGLLIVGTSGAVALAAATAKTVYQIIAASNHRIKIKAWGVYFDGATATNVPVVVKLDRQTTAIGGSPTAATLKKIEPGAAETVQTTGAISAGGAEPTTTDNMKTIEVHPQSSYEEQCPPGDEYIVAGGARLGIVCNAPNVVNVVAWVRIEE